MSIFKQLLLQFILILLNAFFAATEIAVISLNEKKVKARAEEGDKKALKMQKMIEEPTKFLSTIQVGITLAGFLGSAFAAENFSSKLAGFLMRSFDISAKYAGAIDTVSLIVVTLVLSFFTLVLGELVPKRIAMKHKEKLANGVCGTISGLATLLKPVVWLLSVSTNGVLRLFGIDPNAEEETVSEEDIVLMMDAGGDEGTFKEDEVRYVKNVFKLEETTAADVMTPRTSIACISKAATDEEIVGQIESCGFSRIPVYENNVDNVVGILYARDYLLKHTRPDFTIDQAIKDPVYVPETKRLDSLFKEMQKDRTHIVVVVDEYGSNVGIVTMEDILEELVGEIFDERDIAEEKIEKKGENFYLVQTGIGLDDFFEYFKQEKDESAQSVTLNGWLLEKREDIPEKGYTFKYGNLRIKVTETDNMQTQEVSVQVLPETKERKGSEENQPPEDKNS